MASVAERELCPPTPISHPDYLERLSKCTDLFLTVGDERVFAPLGEPVDQDAGTFIIENVASVTARRLRTLAAVLTSRADAIDRWVSSCQFPNQTASATMECAQFQYTPVPPPQDLARSPQPHQVQQSPIHWADVPFDDPETGALRAPESHCDQSPHPEVPVPSQLQSLPIPADLDEPANREVTALTPNGRELVSSASIMSGGKKNRKNPSARKRAAKKREMGESSGPPPNAGDPSGLEFALTPVSTAPDAFPSLPSSIPPPPPSVTMTNVPTTVSDAMVASVNQTDADQEFYDDPLDEAIAFRRASPNRHNALAE